MKKRLVLLGFICLWLLPGCNVIINPITDMVVKDSNENIIVYKTGSYDFGKILRNTSATAEFTIENLSLKELKLIGSPIVEITGNDSSFFQTVSEPETRIGSNQNTTFEISFTPVEARIYSATISIANNFEELNPYTFSISGVGVAPKILVKQHRTVISSGTGVYDFENVVVGETSPLVTFTIINYGTGLLQLTGSPKIKISGNDSSLFIVKEQGLATEIESNKYTEFTISFRPFTVGLKYAMISIENTDSENNPYTFNVTGTGTTTSEINVQDINSKNIPNTGNFDFGKHTVQSTLKKIFIIQNLGNGELKLTDSPRVKIVGTDASAFSVSTQPPSNIAPGYSSTFALDFTPSENKNYSASVSIANNDSDENPYTFTLKGEGIIPKMEVYDSKSIIIVIETGVFEFESTYLNNTIEETFTIRNVGSGNLILNGSPMVTITGTNSSAFSVVALPSTPVGSSSETTFKIKFYPTNYQLYIGTVSIASNDPDANPYSFTIKGQGVLSEYQWTKRFGGTGVDACTSITTDTSGNIFLTGFFNDSVNFGSDFGQSDVKTAYVYSDVFVTKINFNGTYGWTKQIGGSSSDYAYSIATDNSENIFVTGNFRGTVDFGKDFGVSDVKISNGQDIFILKINANGSYGWTKQIGGPDMDYGKSITTDSFGNIYVAGAFSHNGANVNFGADFGVNDVKMSNGKKDIYITKINSNGSYGFTKTFGGTHNDECNVVKIDKDGNIFLTGVYVAQTDFGADFGVSDVKTGCGGDNLFITRINANLTYGWTKKICGGNQERGLGLFADLGSSIYITGIFGSGSVDFESDFGRNDVKTSNGYYDGFVTKIRSTSNYDWTKVFGGTSEEYANSITMDSYGDIYVTGCFWSTVDFGSDFYHSDSKTSSGSCDVFIIKMTSHGSYRWTKQIGGVASDEGKAIHADSYGYIYIAGSFAGGSGGSVDFGTDFGVSETKTSAGVADIFITKIKAKQ